MKKEIKTLNRLVQTILSANTLIPVSEQELLQAFDKLEKAVWQMHCPQHKASAAKRSIEKAAGLLAALICNMNNTRRDAAYTTPVLLCDRVNTLYRLLDDLLGHINTSLPAQQNHALFIPLDNLCASIQQLEEKMQLHYSNALPFTILQSYMAELGKTTCLPYHRWQWWSAFYNAAAPLLQEKEISLEAILTGLNFNTREYIDWLAAYTRQEARGRSSLEARADFLSGEMLKYKLASHHGVAFMPLQPAVNRAMLTVLKQEYHLLQCLPVPEPAPVMQQKNAAQLNTALSVPQLAVFVRLMIDAKIINENNRLALFKNIAGIVCTSKTKSVSPESLRVNFYTPNTAAKTIVKEYLISMINQLKNY